MKEDLGLFGILNVNVFDNGILIDSWTDKNLIVTLGKTAVTFLLAGLNQPNYQITNIGFGTGIADPTLADTTLTDLYSKALGTVSYPTATSVKWIWTLDTTEHNNKTITEYGLFMNNAELFSRKIRGAVEKTISITLEGSWEIGVA